MGTKIAFFEILLFEININYPLTGHLLDEYFKLIFNLFQDILRI